MQQRIVFFGKEAEILSLIKCLSGIEGEVIGYVATDTHDRWRFKNITGIEDEVIDVIRGYSIQKILAILLNDRDYSEISDYLNKKEMSYEIATFEKWISSVLKNENVKLRPNKVGIEASTNCQLNCAGCYMRTRNYDGVGKGVLSYRDYQKVIEEYRYLKEVDFANNGEALLNPELLEILKCSSGRGIITSFGGGVNFNYAPDELLEGIVIYGVKNITIAIDGASPDIYSLYRRNGDYTRVIDHICRLNDFKEKYKSDTPHLTWQYVLMEGNECDIEEAARTANSLNMKMQWKLDWAGRYIPKDIDFVRRITGLKSFNREDSNYDWGYRCRELILYPRINWDGMLLGCCSSHTMNFGINVFETGIENAVNDTKYRKAVIDVFSRRHPDSDVPCGNCWIYDEKILN